MIEDLLNLARLELGEQLTTEPLLLQHVIRRFASSFSHNSPNREVLVDVPDDLEPVLAEPTYVEQVLRNLISNAEKYSPPESPVELRAERTTGRRARDFGSRQGTGHPGGRIGSGVRAILPIEPTAQSERGVWAWG